MAWERTRRGERRRRERRRGERWRHEGKVEAQGEARELG